MREEWLDRPALRGREDGQGEMESEACPDHLDLKESPDCRDFLVWWEPRVTADTREMLVTRETKDPGE